MNTLLFLHGAIGSGKQSDELRKNLQDDFNIHSFDFSGHGGREIPEEPFSIELFAGETIEYLNERGILQTDIFGYSMGGYVALFLARHYPERVRRIFTLATKFDWTPETAAKESRMLDPLKIEEKIPAFAGALKERHAPADWRSVLLKTADMMVEMGAAPPLKEEDFKLIEHRALLSVGDSDKMVSIEETEKVRRSLKNAELKVLSSTQHPIEAVDAGSLAREIRAFFS